MPSPSRSFAPHTRSPRRCLVIGGGVAGLTAAYALAENPAYDVVVLEASPQVGGMVRGAEVASVVVDVGAEAMLNRRREGITLARELGLAVVHPTAAKPRVWSRGALRDLPRSVLGVPQDLVELAASEVLSAAGVARVRDEIDLPPTVLGRDIEDTSVGDLVRRRMGGEVVDRLVEPLLGGVYAGRARELSARAVMPGLLTSAQRGSWLAQARQGVGPRRPGPGSAAPIFAGLTGGMATLPHALAGSGRFATRVDTLARGVRRDAQGFLVQVVTGTGSEWLRTDDLIVAAPAGPSAGLLAEVVPAAASELARVESAAVAVVTLALPLSALADGGPDPGMSGFLVPPVEGLGVKAATFSWAKWDWLRISGELAGLALLRASWGRHREDLIGERTDDELIALTQRDLAAVCDISGPVVEAHVQRWDAGLPQYAVGHVARVARIRAATAAANRSPEESHGRIAVCGAAYDGVGIPAVIASARHAAAEIANGTAQ
ncbi:MAG: protoporphyrinogen oxidase [Nocardioides sp.]